MSFLRGRLADEPGVTHKGYSNADFSDFESFGDTLYAPAPDNHVENNIKSKYIPKIDLLEDTLKNTNVELLLKCSPSVKIELEARKKELITKIEELTEQMYAEFDNKGIQFETDRNILEERFSFYEKKPSKPSFDNVPNKIIEEYTKSGNSDIIKKFKESKKRKIEPMSFLEFKARYFCNDIENIVETMWRLVKDDYDKQISAIKDSRENEMLDPIYKKDPKDITEEELMKYFGRNYLKPFEFPVKDKCWLLCNKFPSAYTADNIDFKKYENFIKSGNTDKVPEQTFKFFKDSEKDWEYYRPLLRKYYYSYPNNVKGSNQEDLTRGINMEYNLREEYSQKNKIDPKYNIAVKWYILDNPEMPFDEYLDIYLETGDYLEKDFLIAKDYVFGNYSATSFKEFKKGWVYSDFIYIPSPSESSESSESISETETDPDTKYISNFFEKVYSVIMKPEFMLGLVIGNIIERIF